MDSPFPAMPLPRLNLPRLANTLRRIGLQAKDIYSTAPPRSDAEDAAAGESGRREHGVRVCRNRFR
ncbi:MAG: hypothetical protein ACOCVM_08770 [Desulfovibrionaceae bacterium]